jgi:transposase
LAHLRRLIASDPKATKWHLMLDKLPHPSVRSAGAALVAQQEGMAAERLRVKGKSGILQSMESRAAFLHDPTHQVVFYFTPKHASWMNQVEIWLSILVRKLLKRGNFLSAFRLARPSLGRSLAYYNGTMAKPIKWTYTGLPSRGVQKS